ncbi:MAG: hypothetical protein HND53_11755 [Proteobacteria bacterium]|nr:hypothetical protein [Pseudomonadota bacterium]NOG61168.1 hypothetical protein [Pseudomonadota bacterium]
MTEIQKADPTARKKALFIIIIGGSVGALFLFLCSIYKVDIYNWLDNNLEFLLDHSSYVLFVLFILFSPLIIFSVYFYKFSLRIINDERMPPDNYPVVRDTKVFTGSQALSRARLLQLFSLLLIIIAIVVPAFIVHVFNTIFSSI